MKNRIVAICMALGWGLLGLTLSLGGNAMAADTDPLDSEMIRVGDDAWSFVGAETGRRFVPWGSNMALSAKEDLNLFGERYDAERIDQLLAACQELNINTLKAFLPIGQWLPDPQVPGEARIAPGHLDNLEDFLGLCRKRGIRVVVAFTSWGGNGCQWWHDGGQYWGRAPWKTDAGVDSIDILNRFWTQVATRLRDNPTVFSYSTAVEWTMPGTNLTWFHPELKTKGSIIPSEQGIWYWRRWVELKYQNIAAVNTAWGTGHKAFADIPLITYEYDQSTHQYADPETMILDYQNFRDWTTLRYMQPQVKAIRAADSNHMVTISNHMRFWDLWEGAAFAFMGVTPAEHKSLVDYMTIHTNYSEADNQPDRTDADIVRSSMDLARFVASGDPAMPVMLEEYVFSSLDPKRVAEVQSAIVRGTVGHVAGWTSWYLQWPTNPIAGGDVVDMPVESSWLTKDLEVTPWGAAAKALYTELLSSDLSRIPPKRVIRLNRRTELVPKTMGVMVKNRRELSPDDYPIDYVIPHEPDLDLVLESGKR